MKTPKKIHVNKLPRGLRKARGRCELLESRALMAADVGALDETAASPDLAVFLTQQAQPDFNSALEVYLKAEGVRFEKDLREIAQVHAEVEGFLDKVHEAHQDFLDTHRPIEGLLVGLEKNAKALEILVYRAEEDLKEAETIHAGAQYNFERTIAAGMEDASQLRDFVNMTAQWVDVASDKLTATLQELGEAKAILVEIEALAPR